MTTTQNEFDIVIAGGGMVGACLAAALADSHWRVAVLEARAPNTTWPDSLYDLRVSAISRASEMLFRAIGAWDAMEQLRVTAFREMHVWDSGGRGEIHFDSADIGEPTMGHIIENRVIQSALWRRMEQSENITIVCPATVSDHETSDAGITITLADGRQLRARLLVGADGADSKVRELACINHYSQPYEQHAVVATVHTEQWHRETAWQRFLSEGPLAFLPLTKDCCSIVWTTTSAQAQHFLALTESEFNAQLSGNFAHKLGSVSVRGPRAAFPLRRQYAEQYVKPRLALIGDAAHTIHPLAGQGANLGFLDAAQLADVLLSSAAQKDPGAFALLRRYERARKGDNLLMMSVMDGFNKLFSDDATPLRLLRNAGLALANRVDPLKQSIMLRAMGLEGDLPPRFIQAAQ